MVSVIFCPLPLMNDTVKSSGSIASSARLTACARVSEREEANFAKVRSDKAAASISPPNFAVPVVSSLVTSVSSI